MSWSMVYTAQALKDKQQFIQQGFGAVLQQTLQLLTSNPKQADCIKLIGDLTGAYSKTMIGNHCIVYQLISEQNTIKIIAIV
ncbi:hypothetical protein [Candidatus Albibeggiatoa sp. nov. BB20]|uniref:type II toxin-antitoxin system RelE family toxin n=1 Tax=Candidatus Albibeggiatoa sp. nov. BB20 TaxID=3162723 RepID=UPI0033653CD8